MALSGIWLFVRSAQFSRAFSGAFGDTTSSPVARPAISHWTHQDTPTAVPRLSVVKYTIRLLAVNMGRHAGILDALSNRIVTLVSWSLHLVDDRSPTSYGRELARQLSDLRKQADLGIGDLAREVGLPPSRISGIETVSPAASPAEVRDLGTRYALPDQALTQLLEVAEMAEHKGWWDAYSDLGISRLIELEVAANQICSYEQSVIPWMFQTEDYARAAIRGIRPDLSERVVEERVRARLKRQELLTRDNPPMFSSLVNESALGRPVGGKQVMRAQLRKMVDVAQTVPSITLQVVPLRLGAHPGLDSPFTLLEFEAAGTAVVYQETLTDALYLDQSFEVDRYRDAWKQLRSAALDPDSSVQLVAEIGTGEFSAFGAAAHYGN